MTENGGRNCDLDLLQSSIRALAAQKLRAPTAEPVNHGSLRIPLDRSTNPHLACDFPLAGCLLHAERLHTMAFEVCVAERKTRWHSRQPSLGLPACLPPLRAHSTNSPAGALGNPTSTILSSHDVREAGEPLEVRSILAMQPGGCVQLSLLPMPQQKPITTVPDLIRDKIHCAAPIIQDMQRRAQACLGPGSTKPSQEALRDAALALTAAAQTPTLQSGRALLPDLCQQRLNFMADTSSARYDAAKARNEAVTAMHAELRRAWRQARAKAQQDRLAALKADDIEAYMQLIHTEKSDKIKQLLAATDACLRTFTDRLSTMGRRAAPVNPAAKEAGTPERAPGGDGGGIELLALKQSTEMWNSLASGLDAEGIKQPALLTGGELREYQMRGLRWMVSLHNAGMNGILADEMGLGKTVQVIALVAHLLETAGDAPTKPVLIAAPASVLPNWEKEFATWAPEIKVVSYRGSAQAREEIYQRSMRLGRGSKKQAARPYNVVLTTFEFLMGKVDRPRLASIPWNYLIVDEGHRLKNSECKLNGSLRSYTTRNRLLLTGTPLQNSLDELWALLNFLIPEMFNSAEDFQTWFGGALRRDDAPTDSSAATQQPGESDDQEDEDSADAVHAALLSEEELLIVTNRLHQVLRPFMLRRLKDSVAGELPTKTEHVLRCKPSAYQAALFGAIQAQLATPGGVRGVSNTLMELRNICNHPFISKVHVTGSEAGLPRHPLPAEVRLCSKLEVLDRVLLKLKATGHRVLIFCTMTRLLDVLEDYMDWRGLNYLRLDGTTKQEERGALVDSFNASGSSAFAFLLSVRAGGVGLNLQSADSVIFYDTDWNPQMDAQAAARAHRIGQDKDVLVLRLLTEGTVEERITSVAAEKRGMADRSITGGFFDGKTGAAERQRYLLDLLKQETASRGGKLAGATLTNAEMNKMLARGEEEVAAFEEVDCRLEEGELSAWVALRKGANKEAYARLASDEEVRPLLHAAVAALVPKNEDEGKDFGKGKRARADVRYHEK